MERTLVIIKPDAVQRGLIGEIIARLERRGLKIVAMKMMRISKELAAKHYAVHFGKPFYEGLIRIHHFEPCSGYGCRGETSHRNRAQHNGRY